MKAGRRMLFALVALAISISAAQTANAARPSTAKITLAGPGGNPMLRWSLLDRGRWVHDKPTLFETLAELASFRVSDVADRIACPTLLTAAEEDPASRSASRLYDALTVERKTLIEFTTAEGAGQHCEANGRRLFHQRVYDWLDETLP